MRPALSALLISLLLPTAAHAQTAWDYSGSGDADEGWGALSPDYSVCSLGTQQSPVAINEAEKSSMLPLRVSYGKSKAITQRRELTLLVQVEGTNILRSDGVEYVLKQIRFHTPSEHSVHGEMLPLEMHFIHESADHKVLIVALQAKMGGKNFALQPILNALPEKGSPEKSLSFNPGDLLPGKLGFYAYTGSLSWPPCTEGVEWRVLKEKVSVSQEQIKAISKLIGRNARLLQPLYLRPIKKSLD